jgi:hypothetical protein
VSDKPKIDGERMSVFHGTDRPHSLTDEIAQNLDMGGVQPTPGAAALDASVNVDGTIRLALEKDGQGVSVTLTPDEFLSFCSGGFSMMAQYLAHGLMARVTAGKARRIIT